MNRRLWLASRERRRLLEPLPFGVMAGNFMSVSTGSRHAERIFAAYLHQANRHHAAVILGTEANKVRGQVVADRVAPGQWKVIQDPDIGSPKSGVLVAVRKSRGCAVDVRYRLGAAETSEGGGIRDRWILTVQVHVDPDTLHQWFHRFSAGHADPPRAPRARARFLAVFNTVRGTKAGDLNLVLRAAARVLGGRVLGARGLLHVVVPRWVPSDDGVVIPKSDLDGADHTALVVTLWPKEHL